jgi:hypothetical protein
MPFLSDFTSSLEVEGQKHGGPLAAWITATFLADLAERARTVLALIDVNCLRPFDLLWRRAPPLRRDVMVITKMRFLLIGRK